MIEDEVHVAEAKNGTWIQGEEPFRAMVVGAHPDDPDFRCGGLAYRLAVHGGRVVFVSMTNGDKGHFSMTPAALAEKRLAETQAAAKVYGLEKYVVMGNHDCELCPTLENRKELTRIVREFAPHAIFTHRPNDYHADHRATAQLVMDITYILGVPLWCPDMPIPETRPTVWYMCDEFTKPQPLQPDLVISLSRRESQAHLDGLACHVSQFLEWLPFDMGIPKEAVPAPDDREAIREFIDTNWFLPRRRFAAKWFGLQGEERAEVFELSEYGRKPTIEEFGFMKEACA